MWLQSRCRHESRKSANRRRPKFSTASKSPGLLQCGDLPTWWELRGLRPPSHNEPSCKGAPALLHLLRTSRPSSEEGAASLWRACPGGQELGVPHAPRSWARGGVGERSHSAVYGMVTVAARRSPSCPGGCGASGETEGTCGAPRRMPFHGPPVLLTLPGKRAGHLPGLGLPWAAPEATVRDWGFTGSPGTEQLPVLGTWM